MGLLCLFCDGSLTGKGIPYWQQYFSMGYSLRAVVHVCCRHLYSTKHHHQIDGMDTQEYWTCKPIYGLSEDCYLITKVTSSRS
jgi:hypothetical protein